MSRDNHSQCQLMQLHIDQYLDADLESGRQVEFDQHIAQCAVCRTELEYARRLHMAVRSLPALDCAQETLEPVERMYRLSPQSHTGSEANWWHMLRDALRAAPIYVRYAIPVLAVVMILAGLGREMLIPEQSASVIDIASQTPTVVGGRQYSPEEIQQAMADLDLALDYLESVSERAGILVSDRFVLQQLDESINASFRTRDGQPRFGQDDQSDGPI